MTPPSALVVGCGSIGLRHLKNLKALGVEKVLAFDPRADRRDQAAQAGATAVDSFEKGLAAKPALVVVATPNSLHLEYALAAAKAGCHLFIEKPVSHTLDGLDALEAAVRASGKTALVGCNMRFHPGVALLRKELMAGAIGRPLSASFISGSYLPDWHPWEDYRKGYSARADLGGGAVLDFIHEIDLALDLLGAADKVSAQIARVSLPIETEDSASISVTTADGAVVSLELDYLSRPPRRRIEIAGEKGTLFWDIDKKETRVYDAAKKTWRAIPYEFSDVNEMYLAEMRHLFACVEGSAKPAQGLTQAREALELAVAAKSGAAKSLPRRKTVAVVQARMGSTRLPGKVLKPLGGRPALLRQLERLSASKRIDEVVVATSDHASDDALARAASEWGYAVSRGSESDVLDRMYKAARGRGASTVVRLTGDCPLADPEVIDRVIELREQKRADYAATAESFPDGFDCEVLSMSALETAWKEATLASDREHVCPFVWRQTERFKVVRLDHSKNLKHMRVTLDEERDYSVLAKVFDHFGERKAGIDQIVAWLDEHPEVASLNSKIVRNEGYKKSLEKEST